MIRVEYQISESKLNKEYKQLFPYSDMQKEWRDLQKDYAAVFDGASFPTVLQLLTAPINKLVDVFLNTTKKLMMH